MILFIKQNLYFDIHLNKNIFNDLSKQENKIAYNVE